MARRPNGKHAGHDVVARNKLVENHLYLVNVIVAEFMSKVPDFVSKDDIEGEALIGLLQAADRYDSEKRAKFSTYAPQRMRGAIRDYLRDIDHLSRSVRSFKKKLDEAKECLWCIHRRKPTEQELAEHLGMPLKTFRRKALEAGVRVVSLDKSYLSGHGGDDDNNPLRGWLEVIPDSGCPDSMQTVICREQEELVWDLVESLKEPHRTILIATFRDGQTLKAVGRKVGNFTESRACQVRNEGLDILRRKLRGIQREEIL